jgi:hypothetical protein
MSNTIFPCLDNLCGGVRDFQQKSKPTYLRGANFQDSDMFQISRYNKETYTNLLQLQRRYSSTQIQKYAIMVTGLLL